MPAFSDTLVDQLCRAERVAVLTGAGISAESGIPTFRDPDGIWEKFNPQELANVRAFLDNPELVQGWYRHRREVAEGCAPNRGHEALAELEQMVPRFTLITQNVDDLHNRAGSRNVVELHGNITRNHCIDCERPASTEETASIAEGEAAECPACGGLIRPDVVWFGEMLPPDAVYRAQDATEGADVFLCVGTSAIVYPAARLPLMAKEAGAYTAEFNVEPSAITDQMHELAQGPAGEVLPRLVEAVQQRK